MMAQIRKLLEMVRFSHTLFALPFALLAALMAWSAQPPVPFRLRDLVGILLAMVTARSAAMAFNRLVDRHLDAENPRTAGRHLPQGLLSVRGVAGFTICSAAAFVASTLIFLPNRLPLLLSVPVLALLLGYSYAKRFTALAHFWLGAALMLAPVSAWIAIRGTVVSADPSDLSAPLVLGLAVLLWVAGFDIIYACQDDAYDRQRGLHSVPARWGTRRALRAAAACHLGMVVVLAALPLVFPPLGVVYECGVAAVTLLLIYEHAVVRPDDLTKVNVAFFQVNAVVSLGLLMVAAIDLMT